jgi:hypothetical protein
MIERIYIDATDSRRATARVGGQSGGRGSYGEVTVMCASIEDGPSVHLSGEEFGWLKDVYGPDAWEWTLCDDLRKGALDGAAWALDHASPPLAGRQIAVTIEKIGATLVDSSHDIIYYATCCAVWASLGVAGSPRPAYIDGQLILDP